MGTTSGAGTAYPSAHLSSPTFFSGVRVTRSLVLYDCVFCRSLFVLFLLAIMLSVLLSFGHYVVCSSVFWPLCCLFFCLLAIMLSVLLRYTDSDYPFGIFKLFFHAQLISKFVKITLLVWGSNLCLRVLFTTSCDSVYKYLSAAGRWFSEGTSVSSTIKTDNFNIADTLIEVDLNTRVGKVWRYQRGNQKS
jgi:hypothetical protein